VDCLAIIQLHLLAASVENQQHFLGVSSAYEIVHIAGTTFEYARPSDGPEVLEAPGPTTEKIQLEVIHTSQTLEVNLV
jgi:hypothetical protein